jgi:hypothetical protein
MILITLQRHFGQVLFFEFSDRVFATRFFAALFERWPSFEFSDGVFTV